ncbi:unnamed protein product [Adineta ricciae]|uniref:Ubiquitin-like domain-containing protein n=1 Tax=Adineta ricciae TaxID=249248 RepID=A0A813R1P3_ADIRI|nr:unnamed protein product [Adineta ricciae]CAF1330653.1 unnamed protein product [Adineta ricciae]
MSFIEGIGDDLLYAFGFLFFISIVTLAWFSTHVNYIHFPTTLFIIERRTRTRNEEEESERTSPTPPSRLTPLSDQTVSPSSGNDTQTEHESDNESSEVDEFICEQTPVANRTSEQQTNDSNLVQVDTNQQTTSSNEQENQSLNIVIKFLDDTRKEITANPNDTISKIKQLHFADELANNKMIRFIYQGRELQDREMLRTYNIRDQTIIHCQINNRRPDSSNQRSNGSSSGSHMNANRFDTSAFIDSPPVNISSYFVLIMSLILGFIWFLRIKYRMLFSPISTLVLILLTILFVIFTFGSFITSRQRVSNTGQTTLATAPIQHVHRD